MRKCGERPERFTNNTIVVVTHELNMVEHKCHQLVWLHEGTVMAAGDPDEVAGAYTRRMMSRTEKKACP